MAEGPQCAACGSPRLAAHLRVAGDMGEQGLIPTTDRFGTALSDIVRCADCGHMQLARMPSDAELASAYAVAASDTYVDVYVNGTKSLIIHQGATAHEPQVDTSSAQTIDTGLLGEAKLLLGVSEDSIVMNPTGEWFIHINGNGIESGWRRDT